MPKIEVIKLLCRFGDVISKHFVELIMAISQNKVSLIMLLLSISCNRYMALSLNVWFSFYGGLWRRWSVI